MEKLPRDVHGELSDEALTARACSYLWLTFRVRLKEEARRLGYALAVHGSMKRDLDLIAVPWTEEACAPQEIAEALAAIVPNAALHSNVAQKPHGRLGYLIHVSQWLGAKTYVDLAVIPPKQPPAVA